jgi:hypothetical protein
MKNDTKLFHRLALFVCASAVSGACAMGADPAAEQPSVDATLAGSQVHAHDMCSRFREAGLVEVFNAADQKWLDDRVAKGEEQIDPYFAKLRARNFAPTHENLGGISDASDMIADRIWQKLLAERKDLSASLNRGLLYPTMMDGILIFDPDMIEALLSTAKAPAPAVNAVVKAAKQESDKLNKAGHQWGKNPTSNTVMVSYVQQQLDSKQTLCRLIAKTLTTSQRQAFLDAIGDDNTRLTIAFYKTLLDYRDERHWRSWPIPKSAIADSDSNLAATAPADGKYSIVRADNKQVLGTFKLTKGQVIGFSVDPLTGLDGMAQDQSFKLDPHHFIYYWIKAADKAPLATPPDVRTVPVEATPPK